jgi:hypothetical protein
VMVGPPVFCTVNGITGICVLTGGTCLLTAPLQEMLATSVTHDILEWTDTGIARRDSGQCCAQCSIEPQLKHDWACCWLSTEPGCCGLVFAG